MKKQKRINPWLFSYKVKIMNANYKTKTETVIVKLKQGQKLYSLYQFYLSNFEKNCYCQHDCCGHWFSSLIDIKRKGRKVFLKIGYAQNI
jgi:hypothetical protein